jgi:uncharacterized membrane protein YphA (DoxX/SURF4 family)
MIFTYSNILQIIASIGLLNVWIFRFNKATSYRGGSAKNLKEEFQEYGLPAWCCYMVGTIKVISAILFIIGIWFNPVVLPASIVVAYLMSVAVLMHLINRDPLMKAMPATTLLLITSAIAIFQTT